MTLAPLPRPILDVITHGDQRAIRWLETLVVDAINGIADIQVASIPFILPPVGEYMLTTNGAGGAAAATLAGAANRIDLFPYAARADFSIDQLLVNCTTAVAAAQGKLLVYSADADHKADALLYESGTLDFSTTGQKTAAPSLTFKGGEVYWFGVRHSSTATLSAWAATATPDINGGTAISTSARKVLRRTLAFGTAAPEAWGHVSSEVNPGPATAIWMRRGSVSV